MALAPEGKVIVIDFKKRKKILSFEQNSRQRALNEMKRRLPDLVNAIHQITRSRDYSHTISAILSDILSEMEQMIEKN